MNSLPWVFLIAFMAALGTSFVEHAPITGALLTLAAVAVVGMANRG